MDDTIPTLVVAHYVEDLSWTKDYDPVEVITKDVDLPNLGREPSSYIYYIISNYESLAGDYVFTQGNPLDHCPHFKEQVHLIHRGFHWFDTSLGTLSSDMMGRPHDTVDIKQFLDDIGIPFERDHIMFKPNCIFKVSASKIKERPLEFYNNLFQVLMEDPKACYAFERCVGLIFDGH